MNIVRSADSVFKGAAACAAALFMSGAALAAGTVTTLSVPDLAKIVVAEDGAPVLVDRDGRYNRILLDAGRIVFSATKPAFAARPPTGALPDGEIATAGDGTRAWLDRPTERYGHAVLGDGVEAGGLTVQHPDGARRSLVLPDDTVFEDRYPRFADMNGDGRDEILTVKAYAYFGGALALIVPGNATASPTIAAEADPIGQANRWLNPVGTGDVDGDGRTEALVVITPHIGGTLTAYEWRGERLEVEHRIHGFSNHEIGSRELALSDVADMDGDGIAEAIVPDIARRQMTIVKFDKPGPRVVARAEAGGRIQHRVVVHDLDGDGTPEITFATGDGTLAVWRPGL